MEQEALNGGGYLSLSLSLRLSLYAIDFPSSDFGWSEACNDIVCVAYSYSRQTPVYSVSLPLPKGKLNQHEAQAPLPLLWFFFVFFPFPTSLSLARSLESRVECISGAFSILIRLVDISFRRG